MRNLIPCPECYPSRIERVPYRYRNATTGMCALIGRIRLQTDEEGEASGKWVYVCFNCNKEILV